MFKKRKLILKKGARQSIRIKKKKPFATHLQSIGLSRYAWGRAPQTVSIKKYKKLWILNERNENKLLQYKKKYGKL